MQDSSQGIFFVSRQSTASSSNNTGTHHVQVSPDGKIKLCDCKRDEEMPCCHLLCVAKVTGVIKDILSSEESILQWFHRCFLASSIQAAYSVLIDPAMSSVHELVADKLEPIHGKISKGAPQIRRYASTGAESIGDTSGVKFSKSCSNCHSKTHTKSSCYFKEALNDSDRARIINDRLYNEAAAANSIVVLRNPVQHQDFGTKCAEYVRSLQYICFFSSYLTAANYAFFPLYVSFMHALEAEIY